MRKLFSLVFFCLSLVLSGFQTLPKTSFIGHLILTVMLQFRNNNNNNNDNVVIKLVELTT